MYVCIVVCVFVYQYYIHVFVWTQRGLTQNLGDDEERCPLSLIFMHFYRVETCMLTNIHKLQKSYELFMRVCQVSFSPYRPSNLIDSLIEPLHTRLTYTSIHLCMLVFVSCQGAIFLHMSRGFRAPSKRKLLLGWFWTALKKILISKVVLTLERQQENSRRKDIVCQIYACCQSAYRKKVYNCTGHLAQISQLMTFCLIT